MKKNNIPLIDEKFIQSIWDKLQMSNWIVNKTLDLPEDIKNKNIIYIVFCFAWEKHEFLKIGISSNGHSRLSTHINQTTGVLEYHIGTDEDLANFIEKDGKKEFIKKYCLIQFYRFNDKEIEIFTKTAAEPEELRKWKDYWGIDDNAGVAGPVEYVEKPIQKILIENDLLKYYREYKKG
jgi:hypothetical protein